MWLQTTDKPNLVVHLKLIHDRVQYPCNQWYYKAGNKCNIIGHVNLVHEGTYYYCNLCDYKEGSKCNVMRHVKSSHEGVDQYKWKDDQYKYHKWTEQKHFKLDTCVTLRTNSVMYWGLCCLRTFDWVNVATSHWSQGYLTPSCAEALCLLSLPAISIDLKLHWWQGYLTPSCADVLCYLGYYTACCTYYN